MAGEYRVKRSVHNREVFLKWESMMTDWTCQATVAPLCMGWIMRQTGNNNNNDNDATQGCVSWIRLFESRIVVTC